LPGRKKKEPPSRSERKMRDNKANLPYPCQEGIARLAGQNSESLEKILFMGAGVRESLVASHLKKSLDLDKKKKGKREDSHERRINLGLRKKRGWERKRGARSSWQGSALEKRNRWLILDDVGEYARK